MNSLAAIVLAAGASRRMPDADKLLLDLHGKPLVRHCLDMLSVLELSQRIIVSRPGSDDISRLAKATGFHSVTNPHPEHGMGTSIAAGVGALADGIDGVFVCLGDMPFIEAPTLRHLAAAFRDAPQGEADVVAPSFCGRRGHPVLFLNMLFPQLARLQHDHGAKSIVEAPGARLLVVPVSDPGVIRDIDTPADLAKCDTTPGARTVKIPPVAGPFALTRKQQAK